MGKKIDEEKLKEYIDQSNSNSDEHNLLCILYDCLEEDD